MKEFIDIINEAMLKEFISQKFSCRFLIERPSAESKWTISATGIIPGDTPLHGWLNNRFGAMPNLHQTVKDLEDGLSITLDDGSEIVLRSFETVLPD